MTAPQEPAFAPAFTGSLAGNARPVRSIEQSPVVRRAARVAHAQREPVSGQRFSLNRLRAQKQMCLAAVARAAWWEFARRDSCRFWRPRRRLRRAIFTERQAATQEIEF